ncbi:hypothetical protein D9611_009014 [Ephemerocybe angulata]|uniref:Uncharacterized protein n=1 Tax=Ephemerocybe angulata TaxID=980116 RepID=A0A8H5FCK8_9AGAR|nr:hypothetical protein D9611_009014 [Tulosesus angulatus]
MSSSYTGNPVYEYDIAGVVIGLGFSGAKRRFSYPLYTSLSGWAYGKGSIESRKPLLLHVQLEYDLLAAPTPPDSFLIRHPSRSFHITTPL